MVASTIFTRGDAIDGFTITEAIAPHGHVERYYAAPKGKTGKRVVIACARRSGNSPSRAEIARFLAALQEIKEDGAPKVLAGGVRDSDDLVWLVHEHVPDLISLADYLSDPRDCRDTLGEYKSLLQTDPEGARCLLAIAIGHAAATTLETYAEHGIVHGGLDPYDGIMLMPSGMPVLFGLGYHQILGLDSSGAMLGDPAFWAPDEITWRRPDPRIDIYSLGAILYWIALGKIPVEGRPPIATMIKHVNAAWMSVAIERALERDSSRRFETWAAFTRLWGSLADGILAKADQMRPANPPSGKVSKRAPELPQSGTREIVSKNDEATNRCPAPVFEANVDSAIPVVDPPSEVANAAPTPRVPEIPVWQSSPLVAPAIKATKADTAPPSSAIEIDVVLSLDEPASEPPRAKAFALTPVCVPSPPVAVPSRLASLRRIGLAAVAVTSIAATVWMLLTPKPLTLTTVGLFLPPLPVPTASLGPKEGEVTSKSAPSKPILTRPGPRPPTAPDAEPSDHKQDSEYPLYAESCARWAHCGRGKSRAKNPKPK